MQQEQGTRLHLPLLVQDRERGHVICHVCSKHNHVDYVYIESYSVHSGGYIVRIQQVRTCIFRLGYGDAFAEQRNKTKSARVYFAPFV